MSTHPPLSPRRAVLRWAFSGLFMAFWPLAPELLAQTAINSVASGSALPLRNVLVEMRQVQVASDEGVGRENRYTTTTQQQVLVLNGRTSHIALRTTVPMRFMTVVFRSGRPVMAPGVVLVDATTGFRVTPRWDNSDAAELELVASQAGQTPSAGQGASASATVLVPLNEWTTVAESDQTQSEQRSTWLGPDAYHSNQRYAVQVRISAR